ncbi:MAG: response regulator [Acidobacteria bacterium]|nr:response regulator [Acidobacteriota bacterium]
MAKILVIDDDDGVREAIRDALAAEDHVIVEADNGRDGIAMARSETPDLIISDVVMAGMDGFTTLKTIRDNPDTAAIPLIIITGAANATGMRRAMTLGANDYLEKPFSARELLATVAARLKQREIVQRETEERLEELRRNITLALPHELRTPLASILTAAKLLSTQADTLPPKKICQFGSIILGSGERLHRLVENFLIYAQLDLLQSDRRRIELLRTQRTTDAAAVVYRGAMAAAARANRGGDLTLELARGVEAAMDSAYLSRVIEELVSNACKFSENGTPIVVGLAGDEELHCSVRDEGRGMDEEEVSRLGGYMQFGRRLHEQQGSGLGLTVVRRLIEVHGGELDIVSRQGEGTEVKFSLPT